MGLPFLSALMTQSCQKRHHLRKQRAGWHYSRLEGKVVYGHQVHAAIVGTGDASLCYSLKRCCPERGTKIDMTLELIHSFPDHTGAYFLMDSWYTNPGVLDVCREKGCHLIGAMKTNRILYPTEKRTSASDLAASLDRSCFHLVTVKGRDYLVYRYEGALNKIDHAVVLLSYPVKAFGKKMHFEYSCAPIPTFPMRQFSTFMLTVGQSRCFSALISVIWV